ncbi:AAA family ATPase [Pseudonocardia acaciae]|uniref:ATP-binding protein n=1 Tax=Pseudonocardia acaciae TaxID=551276 RepID=UPI00048B254E|nr:ATP-binding protein [Pseudonocardia acaciae]
MRVAFVGKGGSGKTTLAALFTRYLAELGRPVLAVDADINQHLGQALGLDEDATPRPLGADLGWLKDHLRGGNPRLPSADVVIKTTPPGRGSRLVRLSEDDEVLRRHAVRCAGGARLMVTGEFDTEDIGVSCYHSKTGAVELYLNHLMDGPGEYVVVDMTAGADAFASGLFTRFDLTVLVSEPTQRGIGVYRQYLANSAGHRLALRVVGNKVADRADADYLREQLGSALLASVGHSAWVRAAERGAPEPLASLEPANRAALDAVLAELDATERDWAAYHRGTVEFHLRNARAWANRAFGRDLADQVDPDFVPGPVAAASVAAGTA